MPRWFPPEQTPENFPDAIGSLSATSLPLGNIYPFEPVEVLASDGQLKDPPVYTPLPAVVPPVPLNSDPPFSVQVPIPLPPAPAPSDDDDEDDDDDAWLED
jgi:hypothetical protein